MKSECALPECLSSLRPFLPRWQLICELKNFWYQLESYFPYYVNSDGGKVTLFAIACSNFTGSTLASGMTMTRCAVFLPSSSLTSLLHLVLFKVPQTRSAVPHQLPRRPWRSSGDLSRAWDLMQGEIARKPSKDWLHIFNDPLTNSIQTASEHHFDAWISSACCISPARALQRPTAGCAWLPKCF